MSPPEQPPRWSTTTWCAFVDALAVVWALAVLLPIPAPAYPWAALAVAVFGWWLLHPWARRQLR